MSSKIKNIILFSGIALALILVYAYFIKGDAGDEPLLSTTNNFPENTLTPETNPIVTTSQDFLTLLLSIKGIKLDDKIFSDPAFLSLRDSSIILTPDGNEGRPNPFAPIGSDVIIAPTQ
ncbi:hypothetical protein HZA26_01530 [Candidatus Nomurabacteria bacterium]|nr:hypothetical protein [Candidatus Nomurabacteria bacterium]